MNTKKKYSIGQKFDMLTIVGYNSERKMYICKCNCGNFIERAVGYFTTVDLCSCGCMNFHRWIEHRELMKSKYLGKTINNIKILDFIDKPITTKQKSKSVWVKCLCYCGEEFDAPLKNILSGNTKSCWHTKNDNLIKSHIENCVENTNLLTLQQNIRKDNKTGVKGVCLTKNKKGEVRYRAYIQIKGKSIDLGKYKTLEEAKKVREEAEEKYFHPLLEKYGKIKKEV